MNGIEVKDSSIEGLGIFALRSFQSGERISRVNVIREITAGLLFARNMVNELTIVII